MILKRTLRIFKWFFGLLFSIVLLFTLGLFIFKDQIIESVIGEVNSNLETPIQTNDVELTFWSSFPNLEVKLKDVYIEDVHKKASHKDTLFYSKQIDLTFSPFDFFEGEYKIKTVNVSPGVVNLHTDSLGRVNYNIIKESEEESDFLVKLKNIDLTNLEVNYVNEKTNQSFSTNLKQIKLQGDLSNERFELSTKGKIYLENFKSYDVALIRNKNIDCNVKIQVDQTKDQFILNPSEIKIESLPFTCSGAIKNDSLNFNIESKNILISEMVRELVLKETADLSHLKGEGKVDFKLNLFGGTKSSDPTYIACNFNVENGSLTEPYKNTELKNIFLEGSYTNIGEQKDEKIEIKNFSCESISGPFSGNLLMKDFKNPKISGKANGKLDLNVIQNIFRLKSIKKMKGLLNIDTKFDFLKTQKEEDFDLKSIQASLELINSYISLKNDVRVLQNVNGKINFNGKDLSFNDLKLKIGNSDLNLSGKLVSFMNNLQGKKTLKPEIKITSNLLNLDEILDDGNTKRSNQTSAEFILPDFLKGRVSVKAKTLIYDKLDYTDFEGKITLADHSISVDDCSFDHCNSNWLGNLAFNEKNAGIINIIGKLKTKQTDLKILFKNWGNLGQDVIASENITKGLADLDIDFLFPYDVNKEDFNYDDIVADFNIKIPSIQLQNVALFKDITESLKENATKMVLGEQNINYLNSKLKNVTITDFENKISINNGNIVIPKMDIQSNAMNIELTAIHGFNDIVDYRIVLPYRDLIINEKENEFGIIEKEGDGFALFLKIYGHLDDLLFKWDRKRHRKQIISNIKQETNEIKSMLKKEFGMFSKDKNVKTYEEPKKEEKIEIKLNFNPSIEESELENEVEFDKNQKETKPSDEQEKNKKKGILKRTIQSWKNEEEQEKEKASFTIGG